MWQGAGSGWGVDSSWSSTHCVRKSIRDSPVGNNAIPLRIYLLQNYLSTAEFFLTFGNLTLISVNTRIFVKTNNGIGKLF